MVARACLGAARQGAENDRSGVPQYRQARNARSGFALVLPELSKWTLGPALVPPERSPWPLRLLVLPEHSKWPLGRCPAVNKLEDCARSGIQICCSKNLLEATKLFFITLLPALHVHGFAQDHTRYR